MRLTQIKLSGFKSFVDPTQFSLPGQLIGVVGPNGCGKSNIIDAARWVLGESKASELRGESMQDVIFNGSGQRKPAGRASVELIFDNTADPNARPVGGPWSQYAEIAVKRTLTRDGTSTYLINNHVVRRRDIQDIFLGTGLGPRAYAIIGQGMIGRIIEARPDELRIFLEEAAGVSKYKERRRETENRLADTRENMTRVEDILRELNANLDRLEQQAVVARRYRDLEAEIDRKQKLLWVLRADEAEALAARHRAEADAARLALDTRIADQRSIEAGLERLRSRHQDASAAVHARQGDYYQAAAAVSAIESEIRVVVESRNRLQTQLAQLAAQGQHWVAEAVRLDQAAGSARAALARARDAIVAADQALVDQGSQLPVAEAAARASATELDRLRSEVVGTQKDLEIESTHQRNADRHLQSIAQRKSRLADERQRLAVPDTERLATLQRECDEAEAELAADQAALDAATTALPRLQTARSAAHEVLAREAREAAQIDARLEALKHVQARVDADGKLQPWLDKHELGRLPRLWQKLKVGAGWETAVEGALRERLGALGIGRLDGLAGFFDDAPPAKLGFYSEHLTDAPAAEAAPDGLVPLLRHVELRDPALRALLTEWIGDVYVAEDAADAMARRGHLPPGASFAVRAGHLVGRGSIQFHAADSERSGVLARQHEIEDLGRRSRAQALLVDDARGEAVRADAAVTQAVATVDELRRRAGARTSDVHARQMTLQRLRQVEAQSRSRDEQIARESAELALEEARETEARQAAEASFERLDQSLAELQDAFEDARSVAAAARSAVEAVQARLAELRRSADAARFEERNLTARIAELDDQTAKASHQGERIAREHAAVEVELATLSDEAARVGLHDAIAGRLAAETRLADARAELDALAAEVRTVDESRLVIERDLEPLRTRIAEAALKEQAAQLTERQFEELIAASGTDRASLASAFAEDEARKQKPATLHAEVQRLQQALAGLGAVNLAALDELSVSRERKTFLDAQTADLGEAIATLEDAIRRIDRETRALLQETFDAINRHFGELFPALFGGGEARLVMTGDEILDAGVQVMAQPPGKKNSSIHLLSGGEKALTATALVFAMFQLNPAPFCLLDEVDAPLDDANTERFCNLVRKMSVQTQFLFISHNKIAMEMAQQLIGVTMQEQGVSRVVAVDLESAIGFASDAAADRLQEAA